MSLRAHDAAPEADRDLLITAVERMMAARGFPRFAAFSRYIVPLYATRGPGRTLAGLYPEIISWFERNNSISPAHP